MAAEDKPDEQEPKLREDSDWKRSVAEEKRKLRQEEREARQEEWPAQEVTFQGFMAGLYTQTLMALGEIENPFTGRRERNEAEAAFLIDTIAMLQEKTSGSLAPEEGAYVQNLLTDLRMRYVNRPAPQDAPASDSASDQGKER